jgi:transposase
LAGTQKKALQDGYTIVFVDESGFYLLPGLVRSYAPCGQTPLLHCFETRDHLAAMSGITMSGQLYTMVREEALTSAHSVLFLQHLQRHLGGKVLVIWDGSPIHKGEVRAFLSAGGAQFFHVEQLPPYAPELNPDEGVWQQLKHVELRNLCCRDLRHLRWELHLAIMRLRRKPHLIQACFAGAQLCTKT